MGVATGSATVGSGNAAVDAAMVIGPKVTLVSPYDSQRLAEILRESHEGDKIFPTNKGDEDLLRIEVVRGTEAHKPSFFVFSRNVLKGPCNSDVGKAVEIYRQCAPAW